MDGGDPGSGEEPEGEEYHPEPLSVQQTSIVRRV